MSATTMTETACGPTQLGTTAQAAASLTTSPEDNPKTSSSILHSSISTLPPQITSASGLYLHTSCGLSILDATGGAAVACLGHAHPRILSSINRQLSSGVAYAYAPFFRTAPAEALASRLSASTGGQMSKVFIVSSGTEAVEAGLKLARQYFVEKEGKDTKRRRFVAREGSYHGNTHGALAMGDM
ncbi:Putative aminotransferase class-III, pyridoxal phosphate-dependent transferase, major [Septoria linicola]|uniref:Aminotransferase class-III, pyridoxal phosphate-dependent transferase, major n=1 Tax=Septoria linicola TaxID=215465 RepID=A0A9Q9EIP7_9PEZI|nr:Putative aminotransferase class-III, pyridoxal phosphate-dependent transferase, major [Septoria linicola]